MKDELIGEIGIKERDKYESKFKKEILKRTSKNG